VDLTTSRSDVMRQALAISQAPCLLPRRLSHRKCGRAFRVTCRTTVLSCSPRNPRVGDGHCGHQLRPPTQGRLERRPSRELVAHQLPAIRCALQSDYSASRREAAGLHEGVGGGADPNPHVDDPAWSPITSSTSARSGAAVDCVGPGFRPSTASPTCRKGGRASNTYPRCWRSWPRLRL